MTDEFRILIDSLGNAALGVLGDAVEAVRVRPEEYLATAQVAIVLRHDDWDVRLDALARVDHLREMFLDELVLDFVFEDRGEDFGGGTSVAPVESAVLEYA